MDVIYNYFCGERTRFVLFWNCLLDWFACFKLFYSVSCIIVIWVRSIFPHCGQNEEIYTIYIYKLEKRKPQQSESCCPKVRRSRVFDLHRVKYNEDQLCWRFPTAIALLWKRKDKFKAKWSRQIYTNLPINHLKYCCKLLFFNLNLNLANSKMC